MKDIGRFPFNKNSGVKFRKFQVPNGTVPPGGKDPTQGTARLVAEYKTAVLGTTILSNGKGHFGPTDRDNQTGQSGSRIWRKWSVPFDASSEISGILGWMESAHWIHTTVCCKVGDPVFGLWPCFRPCLVLEDTRFFIDGGLEDNVCKPSKLFNLQYSPPALEVTDYFLITLTVMVCYWLKEHYHNI